MDKEWVFLQRGSVEYIEGLRAFINHASIVAGFNGRIKCPCKDCSNKYWKLPAEVEHHIGEVGMWRNYVNAPWKEHGEQLPGVEITPPLSPHGDMPDMLHDAFGMHNFIHEPAIDDEVLPPQRSISDIDKFFRLVKEAETELYPGCGRTKLSFLVRLYKVKCLSGWTDASMTLLLSELKDWLPLGEQLPESFYKARKIIKDLGLTYEKIDACKNDCMLYRKEYVNDTKCPFCGTSRYKSDVEEEDGAGHQVPNKVLRYFPLGPRLQRLYMSRHTAESMVWHAEHRPKDEVLRHPADSPAWAKLDNTYPEFGLEARNVRLGLASDGFNPFGTMSLSHSTWPVIMSVYNLPPWLCMKQPYMMLSLLIPGPKSPGKNINVYLQPLVDELKSLWDEGLPTFDSFKKETFTMRAALLWTINDFPAYAMLSGWSTKGKKACPVCANGTDSERLPNGHKESYRGHRRWLDADHPFRFMTRSFNGKQEHRSRPKPMDGKACLGALRGLHFRVGKVVKLNKNGKRPPRAKEVCPLKAKSAFFDLPYWKDLLLRHNLDVMHIEKNVTDTIIGSLLGIVGKNKDSLAARLDCVKLDIKDNLHPRRVGNRMVWNGTIFSLTPEEKTLICEVLESAKPPDGFSSNVSRCVRVAEKKLVGLKSHDCHIIMQYLLPLAIRRVLPRKVVRLLLELSAFFRNLCTKVGTAAHFALLSKRIVSVLCHLEKSLPPSFFDVMMHLLIHLADEAAIAGPVHYRWMYPIERYLHNLKKYVRNKKHPESCIAEGYIVEECLTFCAMYLGDDTVHKRNRPGRNSDALESGKREGFPIFAGYGRALGNVEAIHLEESERARAHRFVLWQVPEVRPYIDEHVEREIAQIGPNVSPMAAQRQAEASFPKWFSEHINSQVLLGVDINEDLRALAAGPSPWAGHWTKYIMNGFRFNVKSVEVKAKTQNSGVYVSMATDCYARASDRNPRTDMVDYYGVLKDIIELDYHNGRNVVLFDCDWIKAGTRRTGMKTDQYGFVLVDFNHILPPDDSFTLGSVAQQVFYVKDPVEQNWHVAVKTRPRDYFDMGIVTRHDISVPQNLDDDVVDASDEVDSRTDVEGMIRAEDEMAEDDDEMAADEMDEDDDA